MSDPVIRHAACGCGRLTARCEGEPVRISVCHCLNCKRRSGSAFAAQARFPVDRVTLSGEAKTWTLAGDSGGVGVFSFCPDCGATLYYVLDKFPGVIAIPIGAFADPAFPAPKFSVWESRKHPWVEITGDDVEHD